MTQKTEKDVLDNHLPAPSKGWCLNPQGLLHGTPYHQFGTPWRVQVWLCRFFCFLEANISMPLSLQQIGVYEKAELSHEISQKMGSGTVTSVLVISDR